MKELEDILTENYQVKSTKAQIEDFKDSFLWEDIRNELIYLGAIATMEYDLVGEERIVDGKVVTPNSSETLIHLGDIKGRKKAVSHFLNILDTLLQKLEDQKNDSRLEPTS